MITTLRRATSIGIWAASAMLAVISVPATAQSMDYGALEKLFNGPVTTSATGSPQRDTDVPANMTIITAEDIRRSGARDIPGVLRHVPGVDVMQWTSDHSDVSIRGYDQAFASRTLVMIDGRTVYADCYGYIPWSTLPVELSDIRQIEVVRGPNAALYGFNAADGAINIITYNPRYDAIDTVSLRLGRPNFGEVSAVGTLRLGSDGAVRVSGGYSRNQDFSTAIPAGMVNAPRRDNERASIDANLVYALGANVEIGLEASHSHADRNEMSPDYAMLASKYETNSLQGRVSADTSLGLLQFVAYTNWFGWKGAPAPGLGAFDMHNQVTVARVEDLFNISTDHTVRLELAYRHNAVNTTPFPGATVEYDVFSGSAMWNWQVVPSLTWTNAVRLDHLELSRKGPVPPGYPFTNSNWSRNIDEISFNTGLVWSAGDDDKIRLIAGRGAQLPNLVDTGALVITSPFLNVTGLPSLKPTAVLGYELAWDRELPEFDARLRVALFRQDSTNLIALGGDFTFGSGSPPALYGLPTNIGSSHAHGLEFSASGNLDAAWHWSLGYRLESVSDKLRPILAVVGSGFVQVPSAGLDFIDFEHTTPKHLLKTGLGWSDERWEADAFVNWQSNTTGLMLNGFFTQPVPVGSFATLDGRIGYRLADWAVVAVSGQNLLQDHQRQTSGPQVGRQVYISLTLQN
jgi:outer membrane receptor for ferrienterochelin and colicins